MSTATSPVSGAQHRFDPPQLGVGITFSSGIESILDRHPELIDVVEIEPQTTWLDARTAGSPVEPSRRRRLLSRRSSVQEAGAQHRGSRRWHGRTRPGPGRTAPRHHRRARFTVGERASQLQFDGRVPHGLLPSTSSDRPRSVGGGRVDPTVADRARGPAGLRDRCQLPGPAVRRDGRRGVRRRRGRGRRLRHPARPPQRLHQRHQRPSAGRRVHRPVAVGAGLGGAPRRRLLDGRVLVGRPLRTGARAAGPSRTRHRVPIAPTRCDHLRDLPVVRRIDRCRRDLPPARVAQGAVGAARHRGRRPPPRRGAAAERRRGRRPDHARRPGRPSSARSSSVVPRPATWASSCRGTPAWRCCRSWPWSSAPR